MKKISFKNYGRYSSNNHRVNSLVFIDLQGNEFYFSYKTLVAFTHNGTLYTHQNDWNTTTGKHLNWIDGGSNEAKSRRLNDKEFNIKYNEFFTKEDC